MTLNFHFMSDTERAMKTSPENEESINNEVSES